MIQYQIPQYMYNSIILVFVDAFTSARYLFIYAEDHCATFLPILKTIQKAYKS
jgi:hypothetical protein